MENENINTENISLPENNEKEEVVESQVKSLYNEPVDISMPDLLIPPPAEEAKKNTIQDAAAVAFKFGFIGAGQGGSRIAETFYDLGYRRLGVINTAQQDLNTIKLENKLCIGEGGAGKDPAVAAKCYEEKSEDVLDFMRHSFGDEVDKIFVCAGAGGGTGSGSVVPLVKSSQELLKTLKVDNPKVGVILALPKNSEGKRVNANAHKVLREAYDLVEQGIVSPLILIDNEKIGKLYPNLAVSQFWKAANHSMAGLFHLFNHTASKDSTYSAFDSNDYGSLLNSGLMVFGASPVNDWNDPVAISRAVRENLKNNILTGGVDLSTGNCAAAVMIGGTEQLNTIPQSSLDQAFDQLSRMLKPHSVVHRGIYSGDKPTLMVFSAVAGLERPQAKLDELAKLGDLV